ncbi:hypothetical protein GIB67_023018 [Kingdonia uniflora]|uniref:Uncharacterized protein n=1 Tax=Kingdonia uniflora TaxID=39325 RepID=A0A7J7P2I3_9MAGN|nr:hypothetical protein GIB67_023018 [Kingdonia uniflora]
MCLWFGVVPGCDGFSGCSSFRSNDRSNDWSIIYIIIHSLSLHFSFTLSLSSPNRILSSTNRIFSSPACRFLRRFFAVISAVSLV